MPVHKNHGIYRSSVGFILFKAKLHSIDLPLGAPITAVEPFDRIGKTGLGQWIDIPKTFEGGLAFVIAIQGLLLLNFV